MVQGLGFVLGFSVLRVWDSDLGDIAAAGRGADFGPEEH